MQLYLIRHGQSTNNARWEAQENYDTYRSSDPTLTEKGVRQAELLAEFLAISKPGDKEIGHGLAVSSHGVPDRAGRAPGCVFPVP